MAYIGLTIRNSEAIQAAIYLVVFPMTLTSSVFLPTQTMPGWLQTFAEHQPITIIANALRGLTLGRGTLPAGHTVIGETMLALTWTAGILAVSAPLAVHAYGAQQQLITASVRRQAIPARGGRPTAERSHPARACVPFS
jgi:ABC-type multidrug transport system permease subunit